MRRAKGDRGACDRIVSRIVRDRGRCQYPGCGSTRDLQCCHIISRTFSRTRTRLDNLLCLCAAHHRLIDTFPDEKLAVTEAVYGKGHYDALRADAQAGGRRFDWTAERARLASFGQEEHPTGGVA